MITEPLNLTTLPHDLDAERAVLGAILIENGTCSTASQILQPADFFRQAHGQIFSCINGVMIRNGAVDLVTLFESLKRNDLLEDVGGAAYVGSLVDGVPRSTNVQYYADIVKEKALQRHNIFHASKFLSRAYAEEMPAAELANDVIEGLASVKAGGSIKSSPTIQFQSVAEMLEEPARESLIEDHLYADALVVCFGKRGGGKTQYAALDVIAVATGQPHAGLRPTMAGTVVIFDFEQVWPTRLGAAFTHYQVPNPERLPIVRVRGAVPDLADIKGVRRFVDEAKDQGVRPLLTVVDTLARASSFDENTEGGLIVRSCDYIREHLGGTVYLVAHPGEGNGDRLRGGNQVESAADLVLKLEESAAGVVSVTRVKNRYGPQDDIIASFRKVAVPEVTYGVTLRPAHEVIQEQGELGPRDREVLKSLPAAGATHTKWKEFSKLSGLSVPQFNRSIPVLKSHQLIRQDATGRYLHA